MPSFLREPDGVELALAVVRDVLRADRELDAAVLGLEQAHEAGGLGAVGALQEDVVARGLRAWRRAVAVALGALLAVFAPGSSPPRVTNQTRKATTTSARRRSAARRRGARTRRPRRPGAAGASEPAPAGAAARAGRGRGAASSRSGRGAGRPAGARRRRRGAARRPRAPRARARRRPRAGARRRGAAQARAGSVRSSCVRVAAAARSVCWPSSQSVMRPVSTSPSGAPASACSAASARSRTRCSGMPSSSESSP